MKALVENIKTGDYGLLLSISERGAIAEFSQKIDVYRLSDLKVVAYVNDEKEYRQLIYRFIHKEQVL